MRRRPRNEHRRVLLLAPQHGVQALRLGRAGLARHRVARVVIALKRLRGGASQPGIRDVAQPFPHDSVPLRELHKIEHPGFEGQYRLAERLGAPRDHRFDDVRREERPAIGHCGVGVGELHRCHGDKPLADAGVDVVAREPSRWFVVGVIGLGAQLEEGLLDVAVGHPARFLERQLHAGRGSETERAGHVLNCPLLRAIDPEQVVGHLVEVGVARSGQCPGEVQGAEGSPIGIEERAAAGAATRIGDPVVAHVMEGRPRRDEPRVQTGERRHRFEHRPGRVGALHGEVVERAGGVGILEYRPVLRQRQSLDHPRGVVGRVRHHRQHVTVAHVHHDGSPGERRVEEAGVLAHCLAR